MRKDLRLLLVEDAEDDAELIRLELERANFELDWRRVDTEEDFIQALADSWDLIISDFQMPQFDGLRAFAIFKQRAIDTPFIFVSGALGEDRAVEAMRAGARDYLLKGSLTRLSVAVRRELEEVDNRRAQRAAEETVHREQRRLAMAVEASGAGVFEYRIPPAVDTHFSDRWAEIMGYAEGDLPSPEGFVDWFFERVHADDRAVTETAYADFVSGRTDRYEVHPRLRHGEGHWAEIEVSARAIDRDGEGRATRVVGVMLDMTERRSLEAQLRQAQKMDAVGRLAGGIAHDFNNVLTAIFSFGQFVAEQITDLPAAREDMDQLLRAAKRAESLTAQLLAFSRRKPVSPKVVNLNALVEDMDRMLRRVVGEDIDVATTLAPDLWNAHIDPGSFEQVMVNLAVNARDAMPQGGKLTLETRNVKLDDSYARPHGAAVSSGDYVMVALSDSGTGMDDATQAKVFEPFFTTKEPGKGTGLGLATCYGIIKEAHGYIWVYSEVGRGTTFKIYLPRIGREADELVVPTKPKTIHGSETVLLAEDDEQVRQLVVRALSRLGYTVIEAADGKDALRRCVEATRPIDVLLTDVVMPEMSGHELAQNIIALHPGIKVLYMSGYTENAIVHRGALKPGTHLLLKPFTPESLAKKIRQVLDQE